MRLRQNLSRTRGKGDPNNEFKTYVPEETIIKPKSNFIENLVRFANIFMRSSNIFDGLVDGSMDAAYGSPVAGVWAHVNLDLVVGMRPDFSPSGSVWIFDGKNKGLTGRLELDGGMAIGWDQGLSSSYTQFY